MLATNCYSNPATLNASSGAGYVTNIGGLTSYVTGSPFLLVCLFISDIYGINATLFRELADKVANKAKCRCVCPDLLHGDPFDPENTSRPLSVWIKDHDPEKGFEDVKPVIESLKSEGVHGIVVAGFCWGAKTATKLGQYRHVQAVVLPHPAYLEVDDLYGMKTPIAILGGQNDTITPPSYIEQFKQVLRNAKHKVDHLVKVFSNVGHGWTVRYDPNDPKAVKAANKAHQIMIKWFDKYLKS
ncbi:hypothetical protein VNO78_22609 [Psophocarpus tetragonolobus]|uniref:Dienelactone hydrolase domain-containing protein n=1 Tax=Psophocarpus tetragonolobus TaxID=3891 RepID=A0AAN9S333_PSOTE